MNLFESCLFLRKYKKEANASFLYLVRVFITDLC